MPTSSDRRGSSGFTLLEIMMTLAIIGIALVQLLGVRQQAQDDAFRSKHMLEALQYGRELLAEALLVPMEKDELIDRREMFEQNPMMRFELEVEVFDLSTGRPERDEDDEFDRRLEEVQSRFADARPGVEDEDYDDPHLVRHFSLRLYYPSLEDDTEEEIALEGFWPRVRFRDDDVPEGRFSSLEQR